MELTFSSKSFKGFTLIELIVVVAIIGIISAVGTVAYQGYTKGAKENAVSSVVQQISLGQLSFIQTPVVILYLKVPVPQVVQLRKLHLQ